MLKHYLYRIILPLLLVISAAAQSDTSYSRVFVFGDSLSDTGNLASVLGNFPAPYYMNRISNGPVAVETLAARLGLTAEASLHLIGAEVGSNYAVSGASASGAESIDLDTQIMIFQSNHGFVAPADALYVIFIGGNDVRTARDVSDLSTAQAIVNDAATDAGNAIESLAQSGARSFLVVNAPNIGSIPETHLIAAATDEPELLKRTRKLSKLYRSKLHNIIDKLEDNSNLDIKEFDLFKFFTGLLRNADAYGFINSTDACFSSVSFTFHPDCNNGSNFDQFVFFDEIHPTARVHALVGDAFYETLSRNDD